MAARLNVAAIVGRVAQVIRDHVDRLERQAIADRVSVGTDE